MAFQPAPNIVGVNVRGEYFGEQVENCLYFQTPATPTLAVVTEIAEQVNGWWVTEVLPFLAPEWVMNVTYARSLETEAAPEYIDATNQGDTSAQTSPGLPGNVCFTVKFLTGLTGRSYRGRNYISGLPENTVTGNAIVGSSANQLRDGYAALLTIQEDFDWVWVVLSRQQDGVILPNALGANVISVSYTDLFVDSQRRRLAGRGN